MKKAEVKSAIRHLKSISIGIQLCVIADTVVRYGKRFRHFCDGLKDKVPSVFIWGASMFHEDRPAILEEFELTRPLRSTSVVVSEVMEADEMKRGCVRGYATRDDRLPTNGLPVKRFSHYEGQSGHTHRRPLNCVECGHQVAFILRELKVGQAGANNELPHLKYCDVLALCRDYPTGSPEESKDQETETTSGLITGLRNRDVPVRVVEKGDEAAIRDTALHVGDLVTVVNKYDVSGLERKVVFVENDNDNFSERLFAMSRCVSQLVVIDY